MYQNTQEKAITGDKRKCRENEMAEIKFTRDGMEAINPVVYIVAIIYDVDRVLWSGWQVDIILVVYKI